MTVNETVCRTERYNLEVGVVFASDLKHLLSKQKADSCEWCVSTPNSADTPFSSFAG